MAAQITKDLDEQASHDQRVQALHRFLFEENGYHGCRHEYYHVANSYLDRVIDDREGLPITLSILYMELARRIGIAVEGVGLPGHFVVRCGEGPDAWPLIDVFEKGKRVSKTEADRRIIESSGRQSVEDDFRAQRPREILARVLRNLIGMAQRNRDDEAMVRYCSALVVLDSANSQYRWMRAVARYRSGRLAGALSDVQWLRNARSSDIPPTDLKRLEEAIQAERDLNPQGGPNY
jgi:regulator of sirC expression with transglutaminase-like and TPR domain